MKVVIMAGGKGSRIETVSSEVPKAMIKIAGKPILQHQIETLRAQGLRDIICIVGHKHASILDYFGDGAMFDVQITYYIEPIPLGTAGGLYYLKEHIQEDFLCLNGDLIFDMDIPRLMNYHTQTKGVVSIVTHPNDHPFDSGIIVSDEDGRVRAWLHKEEVRGWYKNCVNAGIHMCSATIFDYIENNKKQDFDRDILRVLIQEGQLYSYDTPEYIKDMGTVKRYEEVTYDIENDRVKVKNLREKQKAVFLDRDGTINAHVGFLSDIARFTLLAGVAAAIRKMNQAGYLVIVVTNQPVIARGEASIEEVERMHRKMETLLGKQGAYVNAISYCPHHPEKGFDNEIRALKCECSCRKPKPGMLLEAIAKYNIDPRQSWMVGDSECDMEAGKAAGCKTKKISEEYSLFDFAKEEIEVSK